MDHLCTALQQWFSIFDCFLLYHWGNLKLEKCEISCNLSSSLSIVSINWAVNMNCVGWALVQLLQWPCTCDCIFGLTIPLCSCSLSRQKDQITILEEAVDVYTSEFERFIKFMGYAFWFLLPYVIINLAVSGEEIFISIVYSVWTKHPNRLHVPSLLVLPIKPGPMV